MPYKHWREALRVARRMVRRGVAVGVRVTARRIVALQERGEELCEDCGCETLPDVCCCGSTLDEHGWGNEHPFVPMGCDCYRRAADAWAAADAAARKEWAF